MDTFRQVYGQTIGLLLMLAGFICGMLLGPFITGWKAGKDVCKWY